MQIRLEDAAALAEVSYDVTRLTSPGVERSCSHPDVQAHMLSNGVLLLPGSNSVRDYLRYNLRPLNLGGVRLRLMDSERAPGASGTFWHQGFLAYAKVVFDWLAEENMRPEAIIGHSLGAAAAQILSKSYAVPGIGFAAPRPKFVRGRLEHDDKCLVVNRSDDPVPRLPPEFHHMGTARLVTPARPSLFTSHKMRAYRDVLEPAQSDGIVPAQWP